MSILTIVLDGLGIASLITGGLVTIRSTYLRENTKDAAILIDTQRKRIDVLEEAQKASQKDRDKMNATINELQGQLKTYKELNLVSPDIIKNLLDTQNLILKALTQKGTI